MTSQVSQNGHPAGRIVLSRFGFANQGFFLAREGSLSADPVDWKALYVDGTVEDINPANGSPRPDPDPAVRTVNVRIPPTMQGEPVNKQVTGSLFTGQMRRLVQCQFSQGYDNKFVYQFVTTQGLLEAYPKVIGADAGTEAANAALRTYFIIEISANGVFAAPIRMGSTDQGVPDISDYQPTPAMIRESPGLSNMLAHLSLGWAYVNRNESGRVQQVLSATTMATVYGLGFPWTGECGWAFSYSGTRASNVLAKSSSDGVDTGVVPDFYETKLVTLNFAVTLLGAKSASVELLTPTRAKCTCIGHGVNENDIALIQGCNEADYNGSHVALSVTSSTFEFDLVANPELTSPATGADITVVSTVDANYVVTGGYEIERSGTASFLRYRSTIWVPGEGTNHWDSVYPYRNSIACDGPVHVFYDGEEQVVTSWSNTGETIIPEVDEDFGPNIVITSYNHNCSCGGSTGDTCPQYNIDRYDRGTNFSTQHTSSTFGFYGTGFSHVAETTNAYSGFFRTNELVGSYNEESEYGNRYGLAPECWYDDGNGNIIKECSSHFHATNTIGRFQGRIERFSRRFTSSSWLVLFPTEREAVMALGGTDNTDAGGIEYGLHPSLNIINQLSFKDDDGPCPGGLYETPTFFGGDVPDVSTSPPPNTTFDTRTVAASYYVRASGGFTQSGPLSVDEAFHLTSEDLAPFFVYNDHSDTVESPVIIMRGGLYYADPTIAPADQKANIYYRLNDTVALEGGFAGLDGLVAVGFVGIV